MARTIIEEKTVYTFAELSDSAKQKAYQKWLERNVAYEWYAFIIDDYTKILEILGFTDIKISFSGFCSQGDGACFSANYAYRKGFLKEIKAYTPMQDESDILNNLANQLFRLQAKNFYRISDSITTSGRYCHEYTMSCDNEDLLELARDFARMIYKTLENEFEYLNSVEFFGYEAIELNCEFMIDGELI